MPEPSSDMGSTGIRALNNKTLNPFRLVRRAAATISAMLPVILCALALSLPLSAFVSLPGLASEAHAETRSLKLYFLHTGERAEITYKRNGRYIKSGLNKINRFLRDWRRNEPTKMDPTLLDLIWEVYQESGSRKAIHVISAYRSPSTNSLLRKRGRGVARKSQHTLGKALDFYLPDVKLSKLRAIGLRKGLGGVGYYPKSGSPFVHMDTGSVRHWPRMSRRELVRVFPKGGTLHVPTDGKPLAGYNRAMAAYKRKKSGVKVQIVDEKERKRPNFFERLVGADDTEDEESATPPAPTPVRTSPAPAPEPQPDPASAEVQIASLPSRVPVPVIAPRSNTLNSGAEIQLATNTASDLDANIDDPVEADETTELASIPVPSRRPQIAETAIASLTDPAGETGTDNEGLPETSLAFATPGPRPEDSVLAGSPEGAVQVAALSPGEIETLRRQVNETLGQQASSSVAPATTQANPVSGVRPLPPEPVGTPDTTSVETADNATQIDGGGATQIIAEEASESTPDRIVLASLEAPTTTALTNSAGEPVPGAPVPTLRPRALSQQDGEVPAEKTLNDAITVAAIEPLEPGVRSTLDIGLPSPNPNANTENEAQEEALIAVATLDDDVVRRDGPVAPTPSPIEKPAQTPTTAPELELAVVDIETPDNETVNNKTADRETAPENTSPIVVAALETQETRNATALAERPVTLEDFSAPAIGENRIGKWALAAGRSIERIDDIQPPAYGKNSIRALPSKVLVAGFTKSNSAIASNRFSGRAVEFQPYQNFTN